MAEKPTLDELILNKRPIEDASVGQLAALLRFEELDISAMVKNKQLITDQAYKSLLEIEEKLPETKNIIERSIRDMDALQGPVEEYKDNMQTSYGSTEEIEKDTQRVKESTKEMNVALTNQARSLRQLHATSGEVVQKFRDRMNGGLCSPYPGYFDGKGFLLVTLILSLAFNLFLGAMVVVHYVEH